MDMPIAPVTAGGISLSTSRADGHDDQSDQRIDQAGGDDAAKRHGDIGVRPAAGKAGRRHDDSDEAKDEPR